jgi:hypothetical protein
MSGARQPIVRHWRIGLTAAASAVAGVVAVVLPLPLELDTFATRAFAAVTSATVVLVCALTLVLLPSSRRRAVSIAVSAAALLSGTLAFVATGNIQRACTARYAGQTVVAGTELTPLARLDLAAHPDQTRDELLFDAGGQAETIWTRESIDRCRRQLAATWFLPIPLVVLGLVAAAQALPSTTWPASAGRRPSLTPAAGTPPDAGIAYDAFVSYRHQEPDATVARELVESLEADGYRVAIDERDFRVNESFLTEMERCIRQSRFTVAIVSSQYLQSGNCEEEAIICKILDMGERRRRLIPIFIETVPTPVWLHGIVGIDATKPDPLVDPLERLKATLGAAS